MRLTRTRMMMMTPWRHLQLAPLAITDCLVVHHLILLLPSFLKNTSYPNLLGVNLCLHLRMLGKSPAFRGHPSQWFSNSFRTMTLCFRSDTSWSTTRHISLAAADACFVFNPTKTDTSCGATTNLYVPLRLNSSPPLVNLVVSLTFKGQRRRRVCMLSVRVKVRSVRRSPTNECSSATCRCGVPRSTKRCYSFEP